MPAEQTLPPGYSIVTNDRGIRFVSTPHGSLVPNQGSRMNPGKTETDAEIISDFMLWFAKQPQREATSADFLALAAKHKIELRNIQFAAFASEETNCFSATIYMGGVKVGSVSNDGHGGCDHFEPHGLERCLNEITQTLPPTICEWIDPKTGKPGIMQQSAELLVGELFDQWQKAKDAEKADKKLQRDLQTKVVFTVKGEKGIWTTKKMDPARLKAVLEKRLVKDADIILNLLPFAEAKAVYDANINVVYR